LHSRPLLVVVLALFVSACTTAPTGANKQSPYVSSITVPQLYLRGVFNWWGKVAAHQFKPGSQSNVWYADINLLADGQPYDFKLADALWTPEQTCGALDKVIVVTTKSETPIHCSAASMNLRFTPAENGLYRFIITETKANYYVLTIKMR